MPTIVRFEEIEAWQSARKLTRRIYDLTRTEQFARDYGQINQIQRASVSVMSNIAEGFESRTQNQFLKYLGRAKASAGEVRCQLYVAMDLEYLSEEQFKEVFDLADKASRQLSRFITYLVTHPQASHVREEQNDYDF